MHTYHHEPTGIRFHYNSDLSGNVRIVVPSDGAKTCHIVEIPADVLSRFICNVMFDTEEMIAGLDRIRDWLNKHTPRASGKTTSPQYVKPGIRFEFEVGDKVVLTFSEERGSTGTVTELLEQFVPVAGKHCPYIDVRLDRDGSQTGPIPITCVKALS